VLFSQLVVFLFISPALNPGVIAKGFANDGQDVPVDGL
jgi:hypothetical protein